jgi:Zn-dependent peptidase ImmA (M78 family)/transcriptional regulator with XRE-family HTH domain
MANEPIPVNPEIIRWARTRAGFSEEVAAEKFKKIIAWEAGENYPTYPQLEQLAESFKIPVAVFFFPEPPKLPPINETFRTLSKAELENIPQKVRLLLRKAKALQLNLYELCDGRNPAEKLITNVFRFGPDAQVVAIAQQVREFFGVTIEEQISWIDTDDALKHWRNTLLSAGVFVFKDAFHEESFSGFCLFDKDFPIIYLNNSSPKTRQIFTIFHELAHLLFHTSGIDTVDGAFIPRLAAEPRKIEVLCNKFAAEFLVPDAAFKQALAGNFPSKQTAEKLAARFHVSREFIFRRFLDANLISQVSYEAAAKEWAGQKNKMSGGGNTYWTKLAYLGRDYVKLALSQYHQNKISQTQLADYLDTKPRYVGTLEEYYARGES